MNEKRRIFTDLAADYDRWFDDHPDICSAQLRLLRKAVPSHGLGLDVGVGSGRFAAPLGISSGIDPSFPLARMAKRRGIEVVTNVGEHLPYRTGSFDYALMMTVICFLDDMGTVFREMSRVLTSSGIIIVGFLERDGEIYRHYHAEPEKGRFLRYARFFNTYEVSHELCKVGFPAVDITTQSRGFCIMAGRKKAKIRC